VADDPDREAGAWERLPPDEALRKTQLLAYAPHLVLEEEAKRLDELHPHVRGEPADVVVRLDRGRDPLFPPRPGHVRVERALHEEAHFTLTFRATGVRSGGLRSRRRGQLLRLLFENADELLADDLALLLGVRDAGEA